MHVHVIDLVEPRVDVHLPLLSVVHHLLLLHLLVLFVSGVGGSKSKLAGGLGKCLLVRCNLCKYKYILQYRQIHLAIEINTICDQDE